LLIHLYSNSSGIYCVNGYMKPIHIKAADHMYGAIA
jgi:hypothetical protein